ncbi:MAG: O-antigen ligase family protein [Opitutaceae bacterium]
MTPAGLVPDDAPGLSRGLRAGAAWTFIGLLIWAPLNFGSTRAGGPEVLAAGCFVGTVLWALSLAGGGSRPHLPLLVVGAVALLFVATLPWLFHLISPTPVAPFTQAHFARIAARWPYSIVWRTPGNMLALTLGLAAAILPLIDLARSPRWALGFSVALTATGVLVALLALAQNYTGATGIYWRNEGRMPTNFCGTFFHHTSAGAYFNTAWPLAFALTLLAWARPRGAQGRRLLIGAGSLALVLLVAAHTSHVSRFPQVAALLVLPVLLWRLDWQGGRRWLWVVAAAGLVMLLAVFAGRTPVIVDRWALLFRPAPTAIVAPPLPESQWPAHMRADLFIADGSKGAGLFSDRVAGWRTALRCIAERPLTGHGPANWMGAASQNTQNPFIRTFFQFVQFTHQDVLQFAVEWGLPAALAWWTLLIGGVVAVIRARHWRSLVHRTIGIAAACALGAVLLQAQADFPLQIPAVALNVVVLAALGWSAASSSAALLPSP